VRQQRLNGCLVHWAAPACVLITRGGATAPLRERQEASSLSVYRNDVERLHRTSRLRRVAHHRLCLLHLLTLLHLLHHPLGRVGCGNRSRRGYRGVNIHLLGVLNAFQALPALQLLILQHAFKAGEAGGSGRAPGERLVIR